MAAPRPRPQPVDDADARERELDDGRMPFLEHLQELRVRFRNAAIFFFLGFVASWFFAEDIYAWLHEPLQRAWGKHPKLGEMATMNFGSIVEPFWVYVSVALWAGIFVSSPFIFHQLWKFVAPGLYKRERKVGVFFAIASAFFFIAGALFCYYVVLERLFEFLLGYAGDRLHPTLFMREYLDFTRNMMLAFGAVFELPVLIYFLARVGLVTHKSLWKFNRWFIVLAFILGAVLTPSPDVVSQVLMALPMIVLYNLSIVVAYFVGKQRDQAAAAFGGTPPAA
ncbi:MAG TPA: twin-arginine translocase subunit TatC [Kofleriaceae bacterium]|jgi:sec-independent protein translocase protein TatC|nr:twin-arginine translocase subunit TatC [Kofleriaceae bacterium]